MWKQCTPVSLISGGQLELTIFCYTLILHTVSQVYACKLSNIERSSALTKLKQGVPVIHMAAGLHVSRQATYTYDLKRLPSGTIPHR